MPCLGKGFRMLLSLHGQYCYKCFTIKNIKMQGKYLIQEFIFLIKLQESNERQYSSLLRFFSSCLFGWLDFFCNAGLWTQGLKLALPVILPFESEVHDIDGNNLFSCFPRTHITCLSAWRFLPWQFTVFQV
jgi:hypothetical protein